MRPLAGVVVLDFSTLLPGPLATLLLAEAGAEVVKIERPGGDDLREWPPYWGDASVHYALLNRGKQVITIDLKSDEGRAQLAPLLGRADVLVEQFRPGVMGRLGLDYPSVSRLHPRLIYCSVTGYGQTGPKSGVAGHDLNYIADTGLLALSMGAPPNHVLPPALIADIAGGSYPAVMNILLALRARDLTGRGTHLDISMTDSLFTLMYWAFGSGQVTGAWPGNGTATVTGGSPRYRLYATKDGGTVAVAALEDRFWTVCCDIAGLPAELRNDTAHPHATMAGLERIFASETTETWRARFEGRDCCCNVVRELALALEDPHYRDRGLLATVLTVPGQASIAGLPVPIAASFRQDR